MYNDIREDYEEKISEGLIDIKTEKIRLECYAGKYYSFNENLYNNVIISLIVSFFSSIFIKTFTDTLIKEIWEIKNPNDKLLAYGGLTIVWIGIVTFIFSMLLKFSQRKRHLYNVCLKALEDIESNKAENKTKLIDKALENTDNIIKNADEIINFCNKNIRQTRENLDKFNSGEIKHKKIESKVVKKDAR